MKEEYVLIGRDEKGSIAATTVQQFRTIQELMVARKRKNCCKAPGLFECKCDIGLIVDDDKS